MKKKKGILYGLGVGPGDPELITLRAARVLNSVDIVFAAASTKNSYSLAISIAKPHIPDLTPIRMLRFPMTRDKKETQKAWKDHALTIIKELKQGYNVAFITLGDPMTYSTYGYILKTIQTLAPHQPVISIPGITSYQASAACLNTSSITLRLLLRLSILPCKVSPDSDPSRGFFLILSSSFFSVKNSFFETIAYSSSDI